MKVSPVKPHIQNKFANSKSNTPVKTKRCFSNRMSKKANKSGDMWVIKSRITSAESVSAANNISTANNVSTTNSVSIANSVNTTVQPSSELSQK